MVAVLCFHDMPIGNFSQYIRVPLLSLVTHLESTRQGTWCTKIGRLLLFSTMFPLLVNTSCNFSVSAFEFTTLIASVYGFVSSDEATEHEVVLVAFLARACVVVNAEFFVTSTPSCPEPSGPIG